MYIRVITPAGGPLPLEDLPPTKGNSDYILHFWIPPSFRGRKRENSRLNSAGDKNDQMSKQQYHTKIFIRVIWPGGTFPHEDLSWTGKFLVNSSPPSCICINNFKFRDSLYLLTTSHPNITEGQYNGRTIYYHPQSEIGCPISSLIHKLGWPKRPIIQIF